MGLIGCGKHALSSHLPAISKIHNVDLVAVADINKDRAKSAMKEYEAERWFTDYKKLLEIDDIEVVDVVTPVHTHAKIVIDSANAKKHVICEVPMVYNLAEADEVIKSANKNNVKVMFAESRRFWPKFKIVKQILEEGLIGEIQVMKSLELRSWDIRIEEDWRWKSSYFGKLGFGGQSGHHMADLFTWFTNSHAVRVFAVGRVTKNTIYPDADMADHSVFSILFENGALGILGGGYIAPRKNPIYTPTSEIVGSEGVIQTSDMETVTAIITTDCGMDIPYASSQFLSGGGLISGKYNPFYEEISRFLDCIKEDKAPPVSLQDSRAAIEIMIAVQRSIVFGKPIDLPLKE